MKKKTVSRKDTKSTKDKSFKCFLVSFVSLCEQFF